MIKAHVIRRLRRTLVAVACAALMTVGALPATAQASPPAPLSGTSSGYFAPYPGGDVAPQAESGNITAGSCTYRQAVDDPHPSGSETSAHGWWLMISGTCPSTANVEVYLQAYFCGSTGCGWISVASGSGDYSAGGGSGNRATARKACANSSTVGWRAFVDVDLNGVVDPSGYTYSAITNLSCSP